MIATWMLYGTAIGTLLAAAAHGLERGFRLYRFPTRFLWIGAILLSLLIPVAVCLAPADPAPLAEMPGEMEITSEAVQLVGFPVPPTAGEPVSPALDPDRFVLPLWAVASLGLGAAFGLSLLELSRSRRTWRPTTTASTPVLVSPGTGPAVVGFFRPEIVLPEWVASGDESLQSLIVAHEREHIRAGDSRALLFGLLALVLTPWNAALWWQVKRLRLALEVDCDARVLRERPDVRSYGMLLVQVGSFAENARFPVAAFSESKSSLARRIAIMTAPKPKYPLRRAAALSAVSALVLIAVAAVPAPEPPVFARIAPLEIEVPASGDWRVNAPADPVPARSTTAPVLPIGTTEVPTADARDTIRVYDISEVDQRPEVTNASEAARSLARNYPPLLRDAGISGTVHLDLVIDTTGMVTEARVASATRKEFGPAALRLVEVMRFSPAQEDGRAVAVRFEFPVSFVATGSAADSGVVPGAPTEGIQAAIQRAYPPLLRDAGVTGEAVLALDIDETGAVMNAQVVRATHEAFGDAALEVIRTARFSPLKIGGHPVPVRVQLPITFQLPDEQPVP